MPTEHRRQRHRTAFKMTTRHPTPVEVARLALFDAMELLWLANVMTTAELKAVDRRIDIVFPTETKK